MDNNLFIKNILILIFCIILIHLFLNDFLINSTCNITKNQFQDDTKNQFQDDAKNQFQDDITNNKTKEQFQNNIIDKNKTKVYLFYADWCGHCKHYKPIFNNFKNKVLNNNNIIIIEVNADDENTEKEILYKKYNIDGFPTTIIEKNNNIIKLVGKKSIDELFDTINKIDNVDNKIDNIDNKTNNIENKINNIENKINNIESVPIYNDEIIIYNFNTTWCSHSKNFEPIWNKFSNLLKRYNNVKAIDVKCDLNENINFCSKFNIQTVPMIVISRNNTLTAYNGPRTVEALMTEINNN
jgi:thiol-disulfide isomerase/thioredoxin